MFGLLIKALYAVVGWFLLIPVVAYAVATGKDRLPKLFYTWDNEEDGYNGDKRGWYSNYLGRKVTWWDAYKWCAWRNPCWNIRYHAWASMDVSEGTLVNFKGNTRVHDFKHLYERMWYTCVTNGNTSNFRAIPRGDGTYWYIRWGWKIYPEYYKAGATLPKYKDRSVWAISIRIRGTKE